MNLRLDLRILGWLLVLLGAFQLVPAVAAVIYRESVLPYLASALTSGISGAVLVVVVRAPSTVLRPRDGFVVVASAWFIASLFGAIPYTATGVLGPVDAIFESVSGFTTTGSTVMTTIEGSPHALLLWRSFTQWLGGMGIILFTIAIMPLLGIGGMQLFKAEVPGPVADKLTPRLAETARHLWMVYVGFTTAECLALRVAGMSWFDALCHSFTTLATGGFSTRNASVGAYHSPAIEWIIVVFMMLAAINFVLHYRLLQGRWREVLRDAELRYFLLVIATASVVLLVVVPWGGGGAEPAVRTVVFQVVSIVTTTGYGTADFEFWPSLAQIVLLQLMILGGMAGSTGGGIKSLRALLGIRALTSVVGRLLHPHAVVPIKYGGRAVQASVLAGVWAFLTAYFAIALVTAAVTAAAGYDIVTAFSAALTALGNVGPGLGEIGPAEHFAHLPAVVKLVLALAMLAGRLEIFTLLVLVLPAFWRR